ncbi:MAG: polymer-forming cytoskeletal protein [Deltaproteobacteria bacterium]|nr:polymer-forming cytoskeletal protein [Deltaproteobacteria bacterium]MBN2671018.1 polymer-forming cytoskeletal protein [Deltaproteobacteria bacterium]
MSEPITIIGSETIVSGNLEGDEDLTIEGRVEGSISLSRTLTVEVGGVVRADINVRNAVISGVLVGNVEAQESVHITEQGRVVGDISSPRVILVDGSSFKGNIDMGDFDIEQEVPMRKATKSAPTPVTRKRTLDEPKEVEEVVVDEENKAVEAEAPAAVSRVRRAVPVRTTAASAAPPVNRPLPAKVPAKKEPPAPKVRSIGKKTKAKKKKA